MSEQTAKKTARRKARKAKRFLVRGDLVHYDASPMPTKTAQELGRYFREIPAGKMVTLSSVQCSAGKSVTSVQALGRALRVIKFAKG